MLMFPSSFVHSLHTHDHSVRAVAVCLSPFKPLKILCARDQSSFIALALQLPTWFPRSNYYRSKSCAPCLMIINAIWTCNCCRSFISKEWSRRWHLSSNTSVRACFIRITIKWVAICVALRQKDGQKRMRKICHCAIQRRVHLVSFYVEYKITNFTGKCFFLQLMLLN